MPGALGTWSAEGWRDAEETPSATAARIAAEAAARFDENQPMPGERVDTEHSELGASDPDAAFLGLPSWLEDETAEETARERGERSFAPADASVNVPLDASGAHAPTGVETTDRNPASKTMTIRGDASDLRGAVGRMRSKLEAVGAAREAHLAEVRAFLDLSGRKRLGADTPPSPATAAATRARTKMHRMTSEGFVRTAGDADGSEGENDGEPERKKRSSSVAPDGDAASAVGVSPFFSRALRPRHPASVQRSAKPDRTHSPSSVAASHAASAMSPSASTRAAAKARACAGGPAGTAGTDPGRREATREKASPSPRRRHEIASFAICAGT